MLTSLLWGRVQPEAGEVVGGGGLPAEGRVAGPHHASWRVGGVPQDHALIVVSGQGPLAEAQQKAQQAAHPQPG